MTDAQKTLRTLAIEMNKISGCRDVCRRCGTTAIDLDGHECIERRRFMLEKDEQKTVEEPSPLLSGIYSEISIKICGLTPDQIREMKIKNAALEAMNKRQAGLIERYEKAFELLKDLAGFWESVDSKKIQEIINEALEGEK